MLLSSLALYVIVHFLKNIFEMSNTRKLTKQSVQKDSLNNSLSLNLSDFVAKKPEMDLKSIQFLKTMPKGKI